MIEKSVDDGTRLEIGIDVEYKDEEAIEVKTGRMISGKNKELIQGCLDKMDEAKGALEDLIAGAVDVEVVDEEVKHEDEIEEKEEFEIIEKEEDHIEFDLDAPIEKAETDLLDIDEDMIKAAISSALQKNEVKVDTKSISKEVMARLMGKAVL
jgi:thymidine kinase